MPNLYFCQPHAKNQGMLRAVLSLNECERVVSNHSVTFFGDSFPSLSDSQAGAGDFAVLKFAAEDAAVVVAANPLRVAPSPTRWISGCSTHLTGL